MKYLAEQLHDYDSKFNGIPSGQRKYGTPCVLATSEWWPTQRRYIIMSRYLVYRSISILKK